MYYDHPKTPYFELNDMIVMIHRREDIPNFLNPRSTTYNLTGKSMTGQKVHLVPLLKEYDANLKSFAIKERQCKFETETDSALFPVYTQQNCVFECNVKRAMAFCACVPWYIPWSKNASKCDVIGKFFQTIVKKFIILNNE